MQRRTLLKVGIATGALLAVAGGTLALLRPGRADGRLTVPAQVMFTALARAVLAELLPAQDADQARAMQGLLQRIEGTIAGMPPGLQAEVDELLTIAASAPGRLALLGVGSSWDAVSTDELTRALQALRLSGLALRQQVFHAFRDMIAAAWFAEPATWAAIGYGGPRAMTTAEPQKP